MAIVVGDDASLEDAAACGDSGIVIDLRDNAALRVKLYDRRSNGLPHKGHRTYSYLLGLHMVR